METDYSTLGNINLENLDQAKRFTGWMYEHVRPHLQGTILEIGSGTGTYSKKVITNFPTSTIILSELDPAYVETLRSTLSSPLIQVVSLDIEAGMGGLAPGSIHSVFALNVFEHIKDDEKALQNVFALLKPSGCFVILVPAHPTLYNRIDTAIDHLRRYTKSELQRKAEEAGFCVKKIYFFNFFSIFGWWWNGVVLRKDTLSAGLLGLFDRLVPCFRFIERYILRGRVGISVIAILEKPTD